MAFTARTFEQILEDMLAHVKAHSEVHDDSVGSVVRTILESAALEDEEQYFQMTQLLSAFSILEATGDLLDERAADYNLRRRQASHAIGKVRIFDTGLVTGQVNLDASIGASTVSLFSTASFPTTYPYTIRIGEGTQDVQDLEVINNDVPTATLTLSSPSVRIIRAGYRCSLVTGGVRTIAIGTIVQSPATAFSAAKSFVLEESTSLLPGNYYSGVVRVRCLSPGEAGNVSPESVSQFQGSPPFANAGVVGIGAFSGGRNRERDDEFKRRILQHIQSLSRGTMLSLRASVHGVEDPLTGQRVESVSGIEDFVNDEVRLYIDNGGGLVPDVVMYGTSVLAASAVVGSTAVRLTNVDGFPASGWILLEEDGVHSAELVEYVSRSGSDLQLATSLAHDHNANDTRVSLVDVIADPAVIGKRFYKTQKYPIVRNSDRFFITNGTSFRVMTPGQDYDVSLGNGSLQLYPSVSITGTEKILANYSYYTGLIGVAQQVIEGAKNAPEMYPGVRAAGVKVVVEAPIIRRVQVRLALSVEEGYTEEDIIPVVKSSIEAYIMSLGVGEPVIRSKMEDIAFDTAGVKDAVVLSPKSNVTILENEKAVPFSSSGASLVQVS